MENLFKSHHPIRHVKSFKHAFTGIFHALFNEPNFRIQVMIAIIAIGLGLHYEIGNVEWGILIISMGALLSAEMLNTVVEELLDNFTKEQNEGVRIIKDLAAGFVLVTALTSLAIIILIFGHRVFTLDLFI